MAVYIPVGDGFRIRQSIDYDGIFYYDVSCSCGGYWGPAYVGGPKCNICKKRIPDYIQGFVELCRSNLGS